MPPLNSGPDFVGGTDANAADVNARFDAIETWANVTKLDGANLQDNIITNAKMADDSVGGLELMDDVVGAYRTIADRGGALWDAGTGNPPAGTYLLDQVAAGYGLIPAGSALTAGVSPTHVRPFYLDDADYTMAGRAAKLRLRAMVAANGTSVGTVTFTFGLYPVTVAGAGDALAYSLGTVVTGSTAVVTNPATSALTAVAGSQFNLPSDGAYVLAVATSASLANGAAVSCHAQLQLCHV